MVNSTYAKAYTEVLEIIKYFSEEQYAKIPIEKIEFYKKNMDRNYNFTIDPDIDLAEQSISIEANAIIVNLFRDYYATEEQKIRIKEILELNGKKEEQEKRKKFSPDNIFKNRNSEKQENTSTLPVKMKKSLYQKIINFIKKYFNVKK